MHGVTVSMAGWSLAGNDNVMWQNRWMNQTAAWEWTDAGLTPCHTVCGLMLAKLTFY